MNHQGLLFKYSDACCCNHGNAHHNTVAPAAQRATVCKLIVWIGIPAALCCVSFTNGASNNNRSSATMIKTTEPVATMGYCRMYSIFCMCHKFHKCFRQTATYLSAVPISTTFSLLLSKRLVNDAFVLSLHNKHSALKYSTLSAMGINCNRSPMARWRKSPFNPATHTTFPAFKKQVTLGTKSAKNWASSTAMTSTPWISKDASPVIGRGCALTPVFVP